MGKIINEEKKNSITTANFDHIKNWTPKNEEDLQLMGQKHEELIGQILIEEEDVITSHKSHIDEMVELIKQVNLIKFILI